MEDPYRLSRFVNAQNRNGTYEQVTAELRTGRKVTHWMWYIFPQVQGLGRSPMANEYAIGSLAEAQAYLRHPLLGPRLTECAQLLLAIDGKDAPAILGSIDAIKLRSSMTLFARADPQQTVFRQVLDRYFQGSEDPETIKRLGGAGTGR
jgi:uncharacterized protein (DUF1810 family)